MNFLTTMTKMKICNFKDDDDDDLESAIDDSTKAGHSGGWFFHWVGHTHP